MKVIKIISLICFTLNLNGCFSDKMLNKNAQAQLQKLNKDELVYTDQHGNSSSSFPFPKNIVDHFDKPENHQMPEEMSVLIPGKKRKK